MLSIKILLSKSSQSLVINISQTSKTVLLQKTDFIQASNKESNFDPLFRTIKKWSDHFTALRSKWLKPWQSFIFKDWCVFRIQSNICKNS